jgi:hypothetical protein
MYPLKSQTLRLQKTGLVIAAMALLFGTINSTLAADKKETENAATETTEQNSKTKDTKKNKTKSKAKESKSKAKTDGNEIAELKEMVVEESGRGKNLIGMTGSASQGEVSQAQIQYRPLSRTGEIIEVVPGAVATQHSGSGKANQYFLRGYNLDHGTDFTTYVDGIPMNMSSHAHGQGYMDLNSVIPELVKNIEYGKGPYYAELGDFSSAGYAKMYSMDKLPEGILKFTGGSFGYYRGLLANSTKIGNGDLLYAGEFNLYDGVWQQPEGSKKYNGMVRYTLNEKDWGVAVNAKGYTNKWTATNQIPQSAIDNATMSQYGTMNPTDGGNTNRYSFSTNLWNKGSNWKNDANIYALYYDVNLFSDFTGYLNNPTLGDQIHQFEHRVQTGGNVEHTRNNKLFGFDMDNTIGLQFRHDEVMGLGLDQTVNRQYLSTVSHSNVSQSNVGIYFKNQTYWHEKFRTIAGLRGDFINNDVTQTDNATHSQAINALNSGHSSKAMLSPKLSMIIGPWYDTEYFINAGYGYHSNDARGTVLQVNPSDGTRVAGDGSSISPVNPLAWSRGAEVGIRSNYLPKLNTTFVLWWLQSSQELVFSGDDGTTSVNGMSQRYGLEWTNYYKPTDWLTFDADLSLTTARFMSTPVGSTNNYIPNTVGRVVSVGATVVAPNDSMLSGMYGSMRLRHFGDVPLDSSGVYWAGSTTVVNMATGYKFQKYKVELNVLNIFNSTDNDIAYAYQYAYPAGATPQTGIMKHPVEPRMLRLTFTYNF